MTLLVFYLLVKPYSIFDQTLLRQLFWVLLAFWERDSEQKDAKRRWMCKQLTWCRRNSQGIIEWRMLGLKLCGVKIELIGSGKQNDCHLVKTISYRIKRASQKQLQRQTRKEGWMERKMTPHNKGWFILVSCKLLIPF